jgi:hypothetical protein
MKRRQALLIAIAALILGTAVFGVPPGKSKSTYPVINQGSYAVVALVGHSAVTRSGVRCTSCHVDTAPARTGAVK